MKIPSINHEKHIDNVFLFFSEIDYFEKLRALVRTEFQL